MYITRYKHKVVGFNGRLVNINARFTILINKRSDIDDDLAIEVCSTFLRSDGERLDYVGRLQKIPTGLLKGYLRRVWFIHDKETSLVYRFSLEEYELVQQIVPIDHGTARFDSSDFIHGMVSAIGIDKVIRKMRRKGELVINDYFEIG